MALKEAGKIRDTFVGQEDVDVSVIDWPHEARAAHAL
jgi:hypothetical protein